MRFSFLCIIRLYNRRPDFITGLQKIRVQSFKNKSKTKTQSLKTKTKTKKIASCGIVPVIGIAYV